jgi:hypothetical protein
MDERLEKALDVAKLRQTQNIELRRLKEKLRVDLTYPYGGCNFYIDRNFILFLTEISPNEGTASVVIVDDTMTPTRINDILEFKKLILEKYSSVMNQYYVDYEALRKKRNIKSIVDL